MSTPIRFYKWTVEFEVSDNWVADGFEMTNQRAFDMLSRELGWAHGGELKARVVKRPSAQAIAREQGYDDAHAPNRQ